MNWRASLSDDEVKELYEDNAAAYQGGQITFQEFVLCLAKLGYNATEIAEAEKFYRPSPPEGIDDSDGE